MFLRRLNREVFRRPFRQNPKSIQLAKNARHYAQQRNLIMSGRGKIIFGSANPKTED